MFASFKLNPNNTIMEKTPRYTQRERNMVLNYAAQYKDIIENKRTDAESNRKKDEVWTTIAKEFNSRVYHQRTAKQLRQLYKNMKLLLKKDLTTDGRTESFMDILTALQSQSGNLPLLANHYSDGRTNGKMKQTNNNNDKVNLSQSYNNNISNIESDVVIIKSEDLSDNDQSFKNEMDDDSLSNKDIPEVCLEEDDDDAIFDPSCINPVASYLNLHPNSNHHNNHSQQQLQQQQQQQQSQHNLSPQIQLQQLIQQHQQQQHQLQQRQQQEIAQNQQQKRLRENKTPSSIRRELSDSPEPLNFNNSNDERIHHRSLNNNTSYMQNNINGERLQTIQFSSDRRDNHNKSPPSHNIQSDSNSPPRMNGDDSGGGIDCGIRRRTNSGTESLFALAIEERKRKIELLNAQIEYWRTLTKKIKMSSTHDTDLSVGLCNGTCPCSHSVSPTPSVSNNFNNSNNNKVNNNSNNHHNKNNNNNSNNNSNNNGKNYNDDNNGNESRVENNSSNNDNNNNSTDPEAKGNQYSDQS
ncbi:basic-leucine zipper transcription factor A isoform X2 [Condylostylus longicornis]|uniref:basic-leucine zipper transcription factor A isoform X2 n=1 Tax=Condylostylus longicornis TaxID=2530218 RepID=UPI00244E29DC|nr:basic-leucine zipper transcription factor A isoform X2 [Condylostylus longicornis]